MIEKLTKNIIKLICLSIVFACINISTGQCEEAKIQVGKDGVYLNNVSYSELESFFETFGYTKYIYMPEWKYPPIFVNKLPYDFNEIKDKNKRINLFIRMLVPLALKTNEGIILERGEFSEIRNHFNEEKDLTNEQKQKLEALAEKYDIFTRLKGLRRYNLIIQSLDEKINIIPPSILIANAAIETNWGDSEALSKANSLYKELVWYTDDGLKVEDSSDDSYRIRIFPTLYDSMVSFALKINSNVNYEIFRHSRANILNRDKPVQGRDIAHNMYYNSNIQNFIGLLNYTITFYELTNLDSVSLGFPAKKD